MASSAFIASWQRLENSQKAKVARKKEAVYSVQEKLEKDLDLVRLQNFFFLLFLCFLAGCKSREPAPVAIHKLEQAIKPRVEVPIEKPVSEEAPHEIKVALLAPLSGPQETIGNSLLKGATLALFDAKNPYFTLLPFDTKGSEKGAQEAFKAAQESGVSLIIGPLFAKEVKAISLDAEHVHIPLLTFTTESDLATPNTLLMGVLPETQIERALSFAQRRGFYQFAALVPHGPYGEKILKTLRSKGVKNILTYDARTLHDAPYISALKEKSFDALILPAGGEQLKTLLSLLNQEEMLKNVQLIGSQQWEEETTLKNPLLNGAWFAGVAPETRKDFVLAYQKTFHEEPHHLASLAYDSVMSAALLSDSESFDGFSPTLFKKPQGFMGADGLFRFEATGHIERGLSVFEIQNGEAKVIDPAPTTFYGTSSISFGE